MRVRLSIAPCLIVAVCTTVAAFAWYQGRPRHILVQGRLGSGTNSRANPSAPIVWSHASLQMAEGDVWVDIDAWVRGDRPATVQCTLEGYLGALGTEVVSGSSATGRGLSWAFIRIDRNTWIRSVLHLGPVPEYTLDYSAPRSRGWTALSVLAIVAGPTVLGAWRLVAILRRIASERRRGFEIVPTQMRGPDL
jgi:hypothetical protein